MYTAVITQALNVFHGLLLRDKSGRIHPQIQKERSRDLQELDFQFGTRSHKFIYLTMNNLVLMTAFDILLGLTWMASYRPPADESPSVLERAKFGNTPNKKLLTDPTQRPHHLCLTFAPPVFARRFDPARAPRRNTAAALARKALPAAVPDRRPAGRTLRSTLQNIRAKLPAIGKQRHMRIGQHLNLAHQSASTTHWRS
jgi:hypothetical protein